MKEDVSSSGEELRDEDAREASRRAWELVGTKRCPWQFECEAVRAPERHLIEFAGRMADEAVILAQMLLAARGQDCAHESLNAVMAEAHARWASSLRASQDAGERLPGDVLEVMEERRAGIAGS